MERSLWALFIEVLAISIIARFGPVVRIVVSVLYVEFVRRVSIDSALVGGAVEVPLKLASMMVCRLLLCIRHLRLTRHFVVSVPDVECESIWLIDDRFSWVLPWAKA